MGKRDSSLREPLALLTVPGQMLLRQLQATAGSAELEETSRAWRALEKRADKPDPDTDDLWACLELYRAALAEMKTLCLAKTLGCLRENGGKARLWRELSAMAANCLEHAPSPAPTNKS